MLHPLETLTDEQLRSFEELCKNLETGEKLTQQEKQVLFFPNIPNMTIVL